MNETPAEIKKPQLLRDLVLLMPLRRTEPTSPGGIILTHATKVNLRRSSMEWRVMDVGPGRYVTNKKTKVRTLVPVEVEIGDCVLCEMAHGGVELHDVNRKPCGWFVVPEKEIIAKWKE